MWGISSSEIYFYPSFARGLTLIWSSSVSCGSVASLFSATQVVSFVSTPVVFTGSVASGGIYTFTYVSSSKSTSTSKYFTPGVLMFGASILGIALSSSSVTDTGIEIPMPVPEFPSPL